jgi:hypothetical protein
MRLGCSPIACAIKERVSKQASSSLRFRMTARRYDVNIESGGGVVGMSSAEDEVEEDVDAALVLLPSLAASTGSRRVKNC